MLRLETLFYVFVGVLIIWSGIRYYRASSGRGKMQRQFSALVRTFRKALLKNGLPIEVVDEQFDYAYKSWAETTWKIKDIYIRIAVDFPHLYYQVAPSRDGPWAEVAAILDQRAGITLSAEPANPKFIAASIGAHLANWSLVRSFVLDPGLDQRLAELTARP
jgi:hypothetical protein